MSNRAIAVLTRFALVSARSFRRFVSGRQTLASVLAIIAAYLPCALPRLTSLPRVNVDEPWMMQLAWQLSTTGRITLPMFGFDDTFLLQPGYSLLMAPWMALVGAGIYEARLLSLLIGLATLLLVYRGGTLLGGRPVGFAAAMVLTIDSNFLGAARSTRHDVMSLLLVVASLVLLLEGRRTKRWAFFLAGGMAAGLAMLFHANAYWAVIVGGIWILAIQKGELFTKPQSYAYGCGVLAPLLPLLLQWSDYQRQLLRFVGNVTPSLSPSRIAEFVAAEPSRYRYWYFGLVTVDIFNPWLRIFQTLIVIGVAVLIRRIVRGLRTGSVPSSEFLLLTHVVVSVFLFAAFVPSKVVAYLPHLLVGFAWTAGFAWSTAAERFAAWKTGSDRGARVPTWLPNALMTAYLVTGIVHYQRWFSSTTTSMLSSYERTTTTIQALLPPGPRYAIGFPTFWLPFRDDPATRFYAVTAIAPPTFSSPVIQGYYQFAVSTRTLRGKPIFVLIDEAHWGPMMSVPAPYQLSWAAYLTDHCAAGGVAPTTAYGTLVSFACSPGEGRPPAPRQWIADAAARWFPGETVWSASAASILTWEPNAPGVRVSQGASRATITSHAPGGGVCTSLAVHQGAKYLLTYDAASTSPGDLLSVSRAASLGDAADGSALSVDTLWQRLSRPAWYPQQLAFVALANSARLCFYSETATRMELGPMRLTTLKREASPTPAPRT